MIKINNYFQLLYLFAICVIPISLLISSGISESIVIIISTYFFLNLRYIKKKIYNNIYFYLLLILWFYLIINYFTSLKEEILNLPKPNYSKMLTPYLVETINSKYEKDFEIFGYEMLNPNNIT